MLIPNHQLHVINRRKENGESTIIQCRSIQRQKQISEIVSDITVIQILINIDVDIPPQIQKQ